MVFPRQLPQEHSAFHHGRQARNEAERVLSKPSSTSCCNVGSCRRRLYSACQRRTARWSPASACSRTVQSHSDALLVPSSASILLPTTSARPSTSCCCCCCCCSCW